MTAPPSPTQALLDMPNLYPATLIRVRGGCCIYKHILPLSLCQVCQLNGVFCHKRDGIEGLIGRLSNYAKSSDVSMLSLFESVYCESLAIIDFPFYAQILCIIVVLRETRLTRTTANTLLEELTILRIRMDSLEAEVYQLANTSHSKTSDMTVMMQIDDRQTVQDVLRRRIKEIMETVSFYGVKD